MICLLSDLVGVSTQRLALCLVKLGGVSNDISANFLLLTETMMHLVKASMVVLAFPLCSLMVLLRHYLWLVHIERCVEGRVC
jgi:hypothetical protein